MVQLPQKRAAIKGKGVAVKITELQAQKHDSIDLKDSGADILYRPESLLHLWCIWICWFYCMSSWEIKLSLSTSSQALRQTLLENLHFCYLVCQLYDRCDSGVWWNHIYHPFLRLLYFSLPINRTARSCHMWVNSLPPCTLPPPPASVITFVVHPHPLILPPFPLAGAHCCGSHFVLRAEVTCLASQ